MTDTPLCVPLAPSRNRAALAQIYLGALEGFDTSLLDRTDNATRQAHGLSGLFLPGVPDTLHQARQRIMIVGAETKGWEVLKRGEPFDGLAAYVDRAMARHEKQFHDFLVQPTPDRGRSFMNFVRDLARHSGPESLIWANLFCCDRNTKSPIGCPGYEMIQHYSARLLKAQVEFFAPSVIIFANGLASAPARRAVFPIDGPDQVCENSRDYMETNQIPSKQLWQFDLHRTIRCYRIQHPSSRQEGAAKARRFLLTLLPHG